MYHFTLQQFIKEEDGQGVSITLFVQYGGKSQWETAFKTMEHKLKSQKWNSSGITPLTNHAAYHCEMHTNMTSALKQIGVNVPNKSQQVIGLLDSIALTEHILVS